MSAAVKKVPGFGYQAYLEDETSTKEIESNVRKFSFPSKYHSSLFPLTALGFLQRPVPVRQILIRPLGCPRRASQDHTQRTRA